MEPFIEQLKLVSSKDNTLKKKLEDLFNTLKEQLQAAYQNFPNHRPTNRPVVVISYAWCVTEKYMEERWVQPFLVQLARDLNALGFDPRLDVLRNHLEPGNTVSITDEVLEADFVFLIGTESLHIKSVGDFYFDSIIRTKLHAIGQRVRKAGNDKCPHNLIPIHLCGSFDKSFPSNYYQHTTIGTLGNNDNPIFDDMKDYFQSFQQNSYLMLLTELTKWAYLSFKQIDKSEWLALKRTDPLFQVVENARKSSELSAYFQKMDAVDDAMVRKLDVLLDEQYQLNGYTPPPKDQAQKSHSHHLSLNQQTHLNLPQGNIALDSTTISSAMRPFLEQLRLRDAADNLTALFQALKEALQLAYQNTPNHRQSNRPIIFISYAWCITDKYAEERWVQPFLVQLADDLYTLGFDPRLDVLHSRMGPSSMVYMHDGVPDADFVFLIGTESLQIKSVGDTYFNSAIRTELHAIGQRIRQAGEENRAHHVIPIHVSGAIENAFPSNYYAYAHATRSSTSDNIAHALQDCFLSFQQHSYLETLIRLVKSACQQFISIAEPVIEQARHSKALNSYFNMLSPAEIENDRLKIQAKCKQDKEVVQQKWLQTGGDIQRTDIFVPTPALLRELYFSRPDNEHLTNSTLSRAVNKILQTYDVALNNWQQELAYYISTPVIEHLPIQQSSAEFLAEFTQKQEQGVTLPPMDILEQAMTDFLANQDEQLFLLLGEPGMGKTLSVWSQTRELFHQEMSRLSPGYHWLPIVIDLKYYRLSDLDQLLSKYLQSPRNPSAQQAQQRNEQLGCGLLPDEITALQNQGKQYGYRLLVILDGFDELRQDVDAEEVEKLFRDCAHTVIQGSGPTQWDNQQIKMIVTCRSRYLPDLAKERRYFDRNGIKGSAYTPDYQRRVLLGFSTTHIRNYLRQAVPHNQIENASTNALSVDSYLNVINRSKALQNLVNNPFILKLFVQALPELKQAGKALDKIKRYDIYQAFVRQWFRRETLRLPKAVQKEIGLHSTALDAMIVAENTFIEYAAILANELYRQDSLVVSLNDYNHPTIRIWHEVEERVLANLDKLDITSLLAARYQQMSPVEKRSLKMKGIADERTYVTHYQAKEEQHYFDHLSASMQAFKITSPLKQQGEVCSFIHKSFYEYFLAQAIIHSAGSEKNLDERVDATLVTLSSHDQKPDRRIHHEPQTLKFLEDIWIGHNTEPLIECLKETFFEVIERSKGHPEHGAAAANAITILNWMQTMLMNQSWQGIHIPGANLSYAVLSGTDLQGANLSGARLFRAQLSNVNFSQVQLTNVAFLERAPIKINLDVQAIAYHPHRPWLAIATCFEIWQYDTEQRDWVGQPLNGHTDRVTSVTYAPDGKTLASGSRDNTVRQWVIATGKPFGPVLQGHTDSVTSVAYAPDGCILASGSCDTTVRQWMVATGELFESVLQGHTDSVLSVAYAPDGKTLASGSCDTTVRQWVVATGELFGPVLQGDTDSVTSVAYAPNGKILASGSSDATVRQWVVATGEAFGPVLQGHTDSIISVAYAPNGKSLASGSEDATVRQWVVATGETFGPVLQGHTNSVTSVAYAPDGRTLTSGSVDRTVRQWLVATGEPFGPVLRGHTWSVTSLACSPDSRALVSGSRDGTMRQWLVATGEPFGPVLQKHTESVACVLAYFVTSVAYAPDGCTLASGSCDTTVRQWVVATGEPFGPVLQGHTEWVTSVAYAPDGKTLASGSDDMTVRQWVVATGEAFGPVLQGHTRSVTCVVYAPDGKTLASGSKDKTVRQWLAATGQPFGPVLRGHTNIVTSVAYAPDGKTLASGSKDKTVRQWLAATGKPFGPVLVGHTKGVSSVAYAPDGKTLASGSNDCTVRQWVAATGQPFGSMLQGHTTTVNSLAYAPSGLHLVSAGDDHRICVWHSGVTGDFSLLWCTRSTRDELQATGLRLRGVLGLTQEQLVLLKHAGFKETTEVEPVLAKNSARFFNSTMTNSQLPDSELSSDKIISKNVK